MVKRCLVLGSANSVWSDIDRATNICDFHGVVAAKEIGALWKGHLDGWVSLHPERMQKDRDLREENGYSPAEVHFGHQYKPEIKGIDVWWDYKFEGQLRSASSGIFALKVALEYFHFDQAVLCGIPLQKDQGRIIDNKVNWNGGSVFQKGFEEAMPAFKDRVRSMGGWTALRVGLLTSAWAGD